MSRTQQVSETRREAHQRLAGEYTIGVPDAMLILRAGEHTVRAAIASGEIASIRVGRNIRVLTAPLRRQLGLE